MLDEFRTLGLSDAALISDHVIVDLVTPTGKAGGHDAKAAKGRLARHLLLTTPLIATHKDLVAATKKFSDQHFRVVTKVN